MAFKIPAADTPHHTPAEQLRYADVVRNEVKTALADKTMTKDEVLSLAENMQDNFTVLESGDTSQWTRAQKDEATALGKQLRGALFGPGVSYEDESSKAGLERVVTRILQLLDDGFLNKGGDPLHPNE